MLRGLLFALFSGAQIESELINFVLKKYLFIAVQTIYEPTQDILALFVLRKFILQIRIRSHPVGLDV